MCLELPLDDVISAWTWNPRHQFSASRAYDNIRLHNPSCHSQLSSHPTNLTILISLKLISFCPLHQINHLSTMSGNSSVGQASVYEAGDQRNSKDSEIQHPDRFHEGQVNSHKANDSSTFSRMSVLQRNKWFWFKLWTEDQRTIANKLAREEKVCCFIVPSSISNWLRIRSWHWLTCARHLQRQNEPEPISKEAAESQIDPTLPVSLSLILLSTAHSPIWTIISLLLLLLLQPANQPSTNRHVTMAMSPPRVPKSTPRFKPRRTSCCARRVSKSRLFPAPQTTLSGSSREVMSMATRVVSSWGARHFDPS